MNCAEIRIWLDGFTADTGANLTAAGAFGFEVKYDIIRSNLVIKTISADGNKPDWGAINACLDFAGIRAVTAQRYFADTVPQENELGNTRMPMKDVIANLGKIMTISNADLINLIPDTNFLERRYGSNFFVKLLNSKEKPKFLFKIPRLAILELEALCNRDKNKAQLSWKSRQAYTAFAEVLRLRNAGAELLPQIDPSVLHSFSDIAGKGFSDGWIRREVQTFREKHSSRLQTVTSRLQAVEEAIFLTSDLVNSLASMAEGIPTIYLGTSAELSENYGCSHENFAGFLVALATFSGEIAMELRYSNETKKLCVAGWWSGKTIRELEMDIVSVT